VDLKGTEKTKVVRKSARHPDPGGREGGRKTSGRSEPEEAGGDAGALPSSGCEVGPDTPPLWLRVGGLLEAAGRRRRRISGGIRSSQTIPGGNWELAQSPARCEFLCPTPRKSTPVL